MIREKYVEKWLLGRRDITGDMKGIEFMSFIRTMRKTFRKGFVIVSC